MLRFAITLLAVITSSTCQKYGCLEGDSQKLKPSPEPSMQECTLYSKSSCCYADFTEQLAHSPVIKVSSSYWNRCGQLSKSCEDFTKKIECFYRCSPYAARWIRPNDTAAIQAVPLCQSFCNDCLVTWGQHCPALGEDAVQWHRDRHWQQQGPAHPLKSPCLDTFTVSDAPIVGCLQMSKKDSIAIKYLLSESSEESSSSSSSSSEERVCQNKLLKFEKQQQKEGEESR
ncbi:RBP protein, partial [Oxylabes madagascariensis]|nr:RBP protein [Oxylabes madagascariensis]